MLSVLARRMKYSESAKVHVHVGEWVNVKYSEPGGVCGLCMRCSSPVSLILFT